MTPAVRQALTASKVRTGRISTGQVRVPLSDFPASMRGSGWTDAVLRAIDQGRAEIALATYSSGPLEFLASSDAIKIDGVRVPLSPNGAQAVADKLGMMLPTAKVIDLLFEQAENRLPILTSDVNDLSKAHVIEFSKRLDAAASVDARNANLGKQWVLTTKGPGFGNYGWLSTKPTGIPGEGPSETLPGVRGVQAPVGTRHNAAHIDYSQLPIFVSVSDATLQGEKVSDIRELFASEETARLLSSDGTDTPLSVPRVAGSSEFTAFEYPLLSHIENASDGDLVALGNAAIQAGLDPVCIAAVMSAESRFMPDAWNKPASGDPERGASGLIQFIPSTLRTVTKRLDLPEIKPSEFRELSFREQVPYVIEFYRPFGKLGDCGDYYLGTFCGNASLPDDTVIAEEGSPEKSPCASVSKDAVWKSNSALLKDGSRTSFLQASPGVITAGSVRAVARNRVSAGRARGIRVARLGGEPEDVGPPVRRFSPKVIAFSIGTAILTAVVVARS